jgi:hypothetical protein
VYVGLPKLELGGQKTWLCFLLILHRIVWWALQLFDGTNWYTRMEIILWEDRCLMLRFVLPNVSNFTATVVTCWSIYKFSMKKEKGVVGLFNGVVYSTSFRNFEPSNCLADCIMHMLKLWIHCEYTNIIKWQSMYIELQVGNHPKKYLAKLGYKPDMKYKSLIIFLCFWLHPENQI